MNLFFKKTANFSHEKCSWKNTRKSNSERLIKATHKVIKGEGISHFFATLQEKCRFVTLNCVTCCKKVYRSLINFSFSCFAANISFLVLKFSRKTFSLLLLQWESFKNKKKIQIMDFLSRQWKPCSYTNAIRNSWLRNFLRKFQTFSARF